MYSLSVLCAFLIVVAQGWSQSSASSPPLVADRTATGPVSPNISNLDRANLHKEASVPQVSAIPPLPEGKLTLMGGTILRVDHVLDRLVLQVFGGTTATVLFDERTRVFRDGSPGSTDELQKGMRAYVDTMLDGASIFARNVRLVGKSPVGQSNGQIVEIDARQRELAVRDALSSEPVKMRLAPDAAVFRGDQTASASDLRPGSLVSLTFMPSGDGVPQAQRISILASPGARFVFVGRIEYLDLHRGLMVVVNPGDKRSYEVNFDSMARSLTRDLRVGASVTVQAAFDGRRYEAQSITSDGSTVRKE